MFVEGDLWWTLRHAGPGHSGGWREHPAAQIYERLVYREDYGIVDFDITALDGVNANNKDWGHISDFAFRNFRHDYEGGRAIRFLTDADFETNKRVFSEAILTPTAFVTWCEWSGRCYLGNSGRGHHTAAVYRQCLADGRDFRFKAQLQAQRVNLDTIEKLKAYWVVVCDSRTALWVQSMFLDYAKPDRWEHNWITLDLNSSRWFESRNGPTVLVTMRNSIAFSTAEHWLRSRPNLFWDLSAWLSAYVPVPRNDPAVLFPRTPTSKGDA